MAVLNYIHHNPVKHGYVKKWIEWPYSSASIYLDQKGRKQVLQDWKEYDISAMGQNWDNY